MAGVLPWSSLSPVIRVFYPHSAGRALVNISTTSFFFFAVREVCIERKKMRKGLKAPKRNYHNGNFTRRIEDEKEKRKRKEKTTKNESPNKQRWTPRNLLNA